MKDNEPNRHQAARSIKARIEEIFSLYDRHGGEDYIGEPVSQLEHMVQCAQLAQGEGFPEEVILAAFFHDIGHLCAGSNQAPMGGYGVMRHEQIGAAYLRKMGFSEVVARLVEYHVQAKRFLTGRYPAYYDKLSDASKKTLEYQGGSMTAAEAEAFEADPLFALSIRMREWDERAKEENVPVPDLAFLWNMAHDHLLRENSLTTGSEQ
jgi:phosphonate degradation associated HDIG domain protein